LDRKERTKKWGRQFEPESEQRGGDSRKTAKGGNQRLPLWALRVKKGWTKTSDREKRIKKMWKNRGIPGGGKFRQKNPYPGERTEEKESKAPTKAQKRRRKEFPKSRGDDSEKHASCVTVLEKEERDRN